MFLRTLVQKAGVFCFSVCGSKVDRLAWDQDHAGSSPARLRVKMDAGEFSAATTGERSLGIPPGRVREGGVRIAGPR